MNPDTQLSIGQLDDQISNLRATLSDLRMELMNNPNGRFAFAQLHGKKNLEREIQQKRTLLRFLLQGQPQPCWYFKRLPPEMQVEICKRVTNPEDQLNLLQLFPSLGPLMHWDEGVLYFKLMFPLIKRYLPDWRDLWRLCQISPAFMDVVVTHFDSDLWSKKWSEWTSLAPLYRVSSEARATNLVHNCEQLGRAPWMANMPFLCVVSLELPINGVPVPDFVTRFLATNGEKVWGLEMCVDHRSNISYPLLRRILAATPNLVHLRLVTRWHLQMDDEPLPNNLPELPQLRHLDSDSPFARAFAEKYGATLKSLKSWWNPAYLQNVNLPQLENYHFAFNNFQVMELEFPNSIFMCPLRCIYLTLGPMPIASNISVLLPTFTHFQSSLEELTVRYSPEMLRNHGAFLGPDKCWMLRVKLPKLRFLALHHYGGTPDWLLLFPALNTLTLEDFSQERDSDKLKLPNSWNTRYSTNAWAYLKNLKEIKVLHVLRGFVVSREMHAQYYQKIRNFSKAFTLLCESN